MRNFYLVILLIFGFVSNSYCQSGNAVDNAAVKEFAKFIQKHVRYPAVDKENNVMGHSVVSFDVVGGHIINPRIEKSLSTTCDDEAIRCLVAYNKSEQEGIKLNTKAYTLDINFIIDDGKSDHLSEKTKERSREIIQIDVITYPIPIRRTTVN